VFQTHLNDVFVIQNNIFSSSKIDCLSDTKALLLQSSDRDMQKNNKQRALTITFGTVAENGPGMQHVMPEGFQPPKAGDGLTFSDLKKIEAECSARGMKCYMLDLRKLGLGALQPLEMHATEAWVLVVCGLAEGLTGDGAGGADAAIASADAMFEELTANTVRWDAQALMRGQVKNKQARHNLCFSDAAQEPDYAAGKGTVIPFSSLPLLQKARSTLGELHPKLAGLPAEGNDYFDYKSCGIGFHGDGERPLTVGLRLYGSEEVNLELHYQWYQNGAPIGHRIALVLPHGAGYFMSEKATGFDWKKRKDGILTLRHAAAGVVKGSKKKNRFLRMEEIQGKIIRIGF